MREPQSLTLPEIQQSIREIHTNLSLLASQNIDLSKRRIVNAGPSISPYDYVTRLELDRAITPLTVAAATPADARPAVLQAAGPVIVGGYATRPVPLSNQNKIFIASDRDYVGFVSIGTAWEFAFGVHRDTLANRPTPTSDEINYTFYATDTHEYFYWDGAAWQDGDLLVSGNYMWLSGTSFKGTLDHANSADRVYTLADADGNIVYETSALTDHAIVLGNAGAKVKPGTLGTTTTVLHGNASGDPAYSAVVLTTDVSGTLPAANGGTAVTYNRIADTRTLTNQGADIGATNFSNVVAPGLYRVSYSLEDTTSDVTAGAVTFSVAYTADAGATTLTSAAQVLTGAGLTQGSFFVQLTSGNIAFSTAHTGLFGTAKYALYACLERLA